MSEYNIQMNKYNALNAEYDQLYPQPMKHASTHAKNGSDPILPSSIGAYSKEETDTLLQKKAEYTLLWENASLSSSFGEQTISIDFSEYDSVRIDFAYRESIYISKLHGGVLIGDASFLDVQALSNNKPYIVFAGRRATISDDLQSITFSAGAFCICNNGTWGDVGTPEPYLKPYRIFGIKIS